MKVILLGRFLIYGNFCLFCKYSLLFFILNIFDKGGKVKIVYFLNENFYYLNLFLFKIYLFFIFKKNY